MQDLHGNTTRQKDLNEDTLTNPGWKDLIYKWKLFKVNLYWNYLILILRIPKELWGWGIGLITKIIRKHKLMKIAKNMVKSEK